MDMDGGRAVLTASGRRTYTDAVTIRFKALTFRVLKPRQNPVLQLIRRDAGALLHCGVWLIPSCLSGVFQAGSFSSRERLVFTAGRKLPVWELGSAHGAESLCVTLSTMSLSFKK